MSLATVTLSSGSYYPFKREVHGMRGVDCIVAKCGHLHADRDEPLTQEVLQHVHEAHPDIELDLRAARSYVERNAYEDPEHAGKKRGHWDDFSDILGKGPGGVY